MKDRQLAMNEVAVLSSMNHPNIITYYNSFEKDGSLMIEMEYAEKGFVYINFELLYFSYLEFFLIYKKISKVGRQQKMLGQEI